MSEGDYDEYDENDFDLGSGDEYDEYDEMEYELYDSMDLQDGYNQNEPMEKTESFEVLEESVLEERSQNIINEVMDFLNIPSKSAALILIRHFKWNKEKLVQAYMENPEKVCKAAGVSPTFEEERKCKNKKKKMCCPICLDDVLGKDTFALSCGHRNCKNCWREYLELRITGTTDVTFTKCPAPKCNELTHDRAFKKLVSKEMYKRYRKKLYCSIVEDNPLVKYCPAPRCNCSIKVERKNRREPVSCSCGFKFCFQCADSDVGDHTPATCLDVEKWQEKALDESENVKWLIANTKKCPKCSSPIEKNGGCMHMTCRKEAGGCSYEFCWLCRGPWTEHGAETGGYYACNKYDASKAKDEDVGAQKIKTELDKYMFYFHRYESHRNAMKVADEQRKNAETRASEILDKFSVRAQDTKFLHEAAEQLLKNRRALQWSYVYGFYIAQDDSKTDEKNLFEYLQEDLEKHTNMLSELYERELGKIADYQAFIKWKENVTNYTRVTSKVRQTSQSPKKF
mmetsp:Transcript_2590/g.2897  ORF Transcript_2590/g.2897 Transcript_2590/m.2897 type:complete len:512 (+) Transcript_2590:112-1647(+)